MRSQAVRQDPKTKTVFGSWSITFGRGVNKAKAALNEWCKDVSPSTELRKWYSHDPAKFEEFARRYRAELEDPERAEALQHLRELANGHRLTLLTATKNPNISQAEVLCDLLGR